MAVNLGSAVNVVKIFVPLIREHGNGGHIVNTSSMAGITALCEGGVYDGQVAVRGLSESLRLSLAGRNRCSVLCPGLAYADQDAPERKIPTPSRWRGLAIPMPVHDGRAMDPMRWARRRAGSANLPYSSPR
jgi:NAD(P)-dependent dehydrogenase (short-subunit alcohol dehydrogenase family)